MLLEMLPQGVQVIERHGREPLAVGFRELDAVGVAQVDNGLASFAQAPCFASCLREPERVLLRLAQPRRHLRQASTVREHLSPTLGRGGEWAGRQHLRQLHERVDYRGRSKASRRYRASRTLFGAFFVRSPGVSPWRASHQRALPGSVTIVTTRNLPLHVGQRSASRAYVFASSSAHGR